MSVEGRVSRGRHGRERWSVERWSEARGQTLGGNGRCLNFRVFSKFDTYSGTLRFVRIGPYKPTKCQNVSTGRSGTDSVGSSCAELTVSKRRQNRLDFNMVVAAM